MEFCPRCGTLMKIEKNVAKCPKCGYEKIISGSSTRSVITTRIRHNPKEKMIVIEKESTRSNPVTRDVRCPKCGYNEAEFWFMQTRRSDEPPTRFYKCTRCGHVWREYE
ncbi:MAG: transcription factor S [Sulfolobales archaeon]